MKVIGLNAQLQIILTVICTLFMTGIFPMNERYAVLFRYAEKNMKTAMYTIIANLQKSLQERS